MNYFFWTKYPFVQVGFAFIGGNALAYSFTELPEFMLTAAHYQWLLLSVTGLAFMLLFILFYHIRKRIIMNGFFVLLLFFFLGIIHYSSYDQRHVERVSLAERDTTAMVYGEIITEPELKNNNIRFVVLASQIKTGNQWLNCHSKIKVTLADTSAALTYRDKLLLKGKIARPPTADTPYDFDYAQFLAYQNIHHTMYIKSKPIVCNDSASFIFSPYYYAVKVRKQLEILLAKKIKDPKACALVNGLLVGKRSDLQEDDKQLFTISGTIHVLAVSGMHVVLIYQSICFFALLLRVRQNGFVFNLVVLLFIWFYIFITGLQASASRAAIMITLVLVAKLVQRDHQNINSLMATAFIMLVYNPYYLADAGFILSFLAVTGIILSNSLAMQENKNKITTYLFNNSLISTAAQTATFPYSIHLFHQFPVYFLLANLIIVPLTTLLLFLSIALLIFYTIPYLNDIIVWLIEWLTDCLFYILHLISLLPCPIISRISLSSAEMLLLYTMLTMGIFLFVQRNAKWLWGIAFSIILLSCSLHYRMMEQFHHPAVFISGKKSSGNMYWPPVMKHWCLHKTINHH